MSSRGSTKRRSQNASTAGPAKRTHTSIRPRETRRPPAPCPFVTRPRRAGGQATRRPGRQQPSRPRAAGAGGCGARAAGWAVAPGLVAGPLGAHAVCLAAGHGGPFGCVMSRSPVTEKSRKLINSLPSAERRPWRGGDHRRDSRQSCWDDPRGRRSVLMHLLLGCSDDDALGRRLKW